MSELNPSNTALFTVNNIWMLVSTILVFIMHLGFASLEVGLTRAKNTVNILFKNVSIISIGIITYTLCGFNLMYPGDFIFGNFFGFGGWGISQPDGAAGLIDYQNGSYTYFTDFIFQAMFAATAATIVSGAVAERIKLSGFLLFSLIYVAFIYPIAGSWKWGGGWLHQMGFYDFAGSTLVHSVGGWAALSGAYILGPRIGKYSKKGIIPIMGHSMPLASIGVFLLWFGWYGFNGGSVLSADPGPVSFVFVTTTLAAASGVLGAMTLSWSFSKKPDLSMVLNGSLAGLVGITAGADVISPLNAIIVGYIAGLLVVSSVLFFDRLRIDDPVGAISAHGTVGIFGVLAVSFTGGASFVTQLIGVCAIAGFTFIMSYLTTLAINTVMPIRATDEEQDMGLDVSEIGIEAYPEFK